ncbi:unnamed protein product [Adineta steineri]|uniref:Uncharacterized protein n=1 Tax=Adineta steineri TaxID=433720 RepID=A0A815L262_9BILA|nr:unnamed protein product [Adineta steineri]
MLGTFFPKRSVSSSQLFTFFTYSVRHSSTSSTSNKKPDEDIEHRHRLATTKKMRLLGLQSNQSHKALSIYDNYVYQQKKTPDLRMFAVAINCATIAQNLSKGREIHQYIQENCPHLKDDLMLKQQLRYFYIKCNDQISADKLFQQQNTDLNRHEKTDN